MRKLFFSLVLFSSVACLAASTELAKSGSSEVVKGYFFDDDDDDQIYLDQSEISLFQDHIVIVRQGKLYFAKDLRCDDEGIYVYRGDLTDFSIDLDSVYERTAYDIRR